MPIIFHFQAKTTLEQRNLLKIQIKELFNKEGKNLTRLEYVFCDDAYLLDINKRFLKHDYLTDIISFDLTEKRANGISGEIYISVDMVKRNALLYKASFRHELSRVIFHGALHLCGYKDKTQADVLIMRGKEDFYLALFHVEH